MIDGVRRNDSATRTGVNQMLNGIDPATVRRVEVIRGPRTVLYGSDALGDPTGEPPTGSRWYLGVHNVFDEDYRVHGSGIDAPGIGLAVGARWSR